MSRLSFGAADLARRRLNATRKKVARSQRGDAVEKAASPPALASRVLVRLLARDAVAVDDHQEPLLRASPCRIILGRGISERQRSLGEPRHE